MSKPTFTTDPRTGDISLPGGDCVRKHGMCYLHAPIYLGGEPIGRFRILGIRYSPSFLLSTAQGGLSQQAIDWEWHDFTRQQNDHWFLHSFQVPGCLKHELVNREHQEVAATRFLQRCLARVRRTAAWHLYEHVLGATKGTPFFQGARMIIEAEVTSATARGDVALTELTSLLRDHLLPAGYQPLPHVVEHLL